MEAGSHDRRLFLSASTGWPPAPVPAGAVFLRSPIARALRFPLTAAGRSDRSLPHALAFPVRRGRRSLHAATTAFEALIL
jgi:hypothetical protein